MAVADAIAALKKLRAAIKQNEQGEVVEVSLRSRFGFSQLTDAGLVHLKGLTKLKLLVVSGTRVTNRGVAELKKALPNCKIIN